MDKNNPLNTNDSFLFCKSIWFLFLTELNWDPDAVNPLELIPELFSAEVTNLLKDAKFIGQTKHYYLRESDKYMNYLSKGGRAFNENYFIKHS